MPRAKNRVASRAKRKKLLKMTAGYYGKRANCISIAKDSFLRSGVYAYANRKQNKRNFRSLWIMRINAATRQYGVSYGNFISGFKSKVIELDRKALAHLALHEPDAFKKLIDTIAA